MELINPTKLFSLSLFFFVPVATSILIITEENSGSWTSRMTNTPAAPTSRSPPVSPAVNMNMEMETQRLEDREGIEWDDTAALLHQLRGSSGGKPLNKKKKPARSHDVGTKLSSHRLQTSRAPTECT